MSDSGLSLDNLLGDQGENGGGKGEDLLGDTSSGRGRDEQDTSDDFLRGGKGEDGWLPLENFWRQRGESLFGEAEGCSNSFPVTRGSLEDFLPFSRGESTGDLLPVSRGELRGDFLSASKGESGEVTGDFFKVGRGERTGDFLSASKGEGGGVTGDFMKVGRGEQTGDFLSASKGEGEGLLPVCRGDDGGLFEMAADL